MLEDAGDFGDAAVFMYDYFNDGVQKGHILSLVCVLGEEHEACEKVRFCSMDLVGTELFVEKCVDFLFVAMVEEEVDGVADHAGDLSELALVLICLDIDLVK